MAPTSETTGIHPTTGLILGVMAVGMFCAVVGGVVSHFWRRSRNAQRRTRLRRMWLNDMQYDTSEYHCEATLFQKDELTKVGCYPSYMPRHSGTRPLLDPSPDFELASMNYTRSYSPMPPNRAYLSSLRTTFEEQSLRTAEPVHVMNPRIPSEEQNSPGSSSMHAEPSQMAAKDQDRRSLHQYSETGTTRQQSRRESLRRGIFWVDWKLNCGERKGLSCEMSLSGIQLNA